MNGEIMWCGAPNNLVKEVSGKLEGIARGIPEFRWRIFEDNKRCKVLVQFAFVGGMIHEREIISYAEAGLSLLEHDLKQLTIEEKRRRDAESKGSGEDTGKEEEYR